MNKFNSAVQVIEPIIGGYIREKDIRAIRLWNIWCPDKQQVYDMLNPDYSKVQSTVLAERIADSYLRYEMTFFVEDSDLFEIYDALEKEFGDRCFIQHCSGYAVICNPAYRTERS